MTIELVQMKKGGLALLSDEPFPAHVRRIEYYKDQQVMMLAYDCDDIEDYLIEHALGDDAAKIVESSPDVMILVTAEPGTDPFGYDVPLVQVGI